MSSISLLLCRALMIEFVVILLSLLGVGSLFFGIEALGIIINFFIFILVGAICCIPIAIGIGEYLSRSNKFLIKKLPLGILLLLWSLFKYYYNFYWTRKRFCIYGRTLRSVCLFSSFRCFSKFWSRDMVGWKTTCYD
mgnify:CR=1 FL=1